LIPTGLLLEPPPPDHDHDIGLISDRSEFGKIFIKPDEGIAPTFSEKEVARGDRYRVVCAARCREKALTTNDLSGVAFLMLLLAPPKIIPKNCPIPYIAFPGRKSMGPGPRVQDQREGSEIPGQLALCQVRVYTERRRHQGAGCKSHSSDSHRSWQPLRSPGLRAMRNRSSNIIQRRARRRTNCPPIPELL
jgi:hypothetical protein